MKMIVFSILMSIAIGACSKSDTGSTNTDPGAGSTVVPEVYKKIYGATSITSDGTWITIKTKGMPDHKSPYYPTTTALYEDFSGVTFGGATFAKNPNSINEKKYPFKIPLKPAVSANHAATPLGPIGISLNGVAFYKQYAGPNQPLINEIVSATGIGVILHPADHIITT
jgi:hypothetical protein